MTRGLNLDSIRNCLDGVIPASIGTVSQDGTPNISYVSQVYYVGRQHVALSFQFFNKTRENILANPEAAIQVVDPETGGQYRLNLCYLRTETEGEVFETMKASLSGIASHTGMSKVFHLRGADIYQVLNIEGIACDRLPCALPQRNRLSALSASLKQLQQSVDFSSLLDNLIYALKEHFEFDHGMILMLDQQGNRLYTVDSFGYEVSGIGSEIPLEVGIIGVAASKMIPIRIMYMTGKYSYNMAVLQSLLESNPDLDLETSIPFAGLAEPHSQLAVPILYQQQLLGLIYADSDQDLRFTYEDEDGLTVLADCLAQRIVQFSNHEYQETEKLLPRNTKKTDTSLSVIKHFQTNDSIFIDEEYLIKGVAGAIFWKLLKCFKEQNRTEFTNRELRLDPTIGLPDIVDNLEARLILLQKRLDERCEFLKIEKISRGRFRLLVTHGITLEEA